MSDKEIKQLLKQDRKNKRQIRKIKHTLDETSRDSREQLSTREASLRKIYSLQHKKAHARNVEVQRREREVQNSIIENTRKDTQELQNKDKAIKQGLKNILKTQRQRDSDDRQRWEQAMQVQQKKRGQQFKQDLKDLADKVNTRTTRLQIPKLSPTPRDLPEKRVLDEDERHPIQENVTPKTLITEIREWINSYELREVTDNLGRVNAFIQILDQFWIGAKKPNAIEVDIDGRETIAILPTNVRLGINIEDIYSQVFNLQPTPLQTTHNYHLIYMQNLFGEVLRNNFPWEQATGFILGIANGAIIDNRLEILHSYPTRIGILKYIAPGGIVGEKTQEGKYKRQAVKYYGLGFNSELLQTSINTMQLFMNEAKKEE
jgi:hypothetical protein